MRTEEPRSIALKDYQPPDYRISEVSLTFALDPETTRVTLGDEGDAHGATRRWC